MRSLSYIALRKARNQRLKKSLGVAMTKGKMRLNARKFHPHQNYTVQNTEEFTDDHHQTYKDNIYSGTPQSLSDGLKNFRHVAGSEADLTNLKNPFAKDGIPWKDALEETYSSDDLLTHIKTATKETPFMQDKSNNQTMRMHRFELRDLSRQKPRDDERKKSEAGTAQRRKVYTSMGRNIGYNNPKQFAEEEEARYQETQLNRKNNPKRGES